MVPRAQNFHEPVFEDEARVEKMRLARCRGTRSASMIAVRKMSVRWWGDTEEKTRQVAERRLGFVRLARGTGKKKKKKNK